MLHLHSFTFNPFGENTWLVWSDAGNCLIIDPGCYFPAEKKTLSDFITGNKLNPVRLLNTHCHIDHVLGNPYVQQTYGLIPEIHPLELPVLQAVEQYGALWDIRSDPQPEPQLSLHEGDRIELDGHRLNIIFTPGHAPGEVCFVSTEQQFVIAGDVLFYESIGRTDLPGGDHATLLRSIREKLWPLPDAFTVHPGHGRSTTIGHERKFNPFLGGE